VIAHTIKGSPNETMRFIHSYFLSSVASIRRKLNRVQTFSPGLT
jgi:hypothetical protein